LDLYFSPLNILESSDRDEANAAALKFLKRRCDVWLLFTPFHLSKSFMPALNQLRGNPRNFLA